MKMRTRTFHFLLTLLLVAGIAAGAAVIQPVRAERGVFASPQAARFSRVVAASLPVDTCTLVGTTRTCELWAREGTLALPDGTTVPIWGFTDQAAGNAQLPGPLFVAHQGETLEIILHNELTLNLSLSVPTQEIGMPDLEGVATGSTKTYTFSNLQPGSFLYEAGLTENGARQVAMGLYGALVVRPATIGWAYDRPDTAFEDETVLLLSEIDPAFNADPLNYPIQEFSPKYWLLNGKAYPETPAIDVTTTVGVPHRLLLRYLNAGIQNYSMGLLGLDQRILAREGQLFSHPYQTVAETIAAGQSMDVMVQVPAGVHEATTLYPVYDASMHHHNANQHMTDGSGNPTTRLAYGGMLAFIQVNTTDAVPHPSGPVVSKAIVSPNPTTGVGGVTLEVGLDDTLTGGLNITAAEFFLNKLGAEGTGTPIPIPAPATTLTATLTLDEATLNTWTSESHKLYIRGQDSDGHWGPINSVILNLDRIGPVSYGLNLSKNPTNGTVDLALKGSADDQDGGRNKVAEAHYRLDGGAWLPVTLDVPNVPVASLRASLSASDLLLLAEGEHLIEVSSMDMLGNWGVGTVLTLNLDKTGPQVSALTLTPATLDLRIPSITSVRVDGHVTEAASNGVYSLVENAEGFIDQASEPGSGFAMFPKDGLFDEVEEDIYFEIPTANFSRLSQGVHKILVRGKDSAGNWGVLSEGQITVQKGAVDTEGPEVRAAVASPSPTLGAATIQLTALGADIKFISNVTAAEWFVGSDPGYGLGLPMAAVDGTFNSTTEQISATVDVSSWPTGRYTLLVRAQDATGNWGRTTPVSVYVSGNVGTTLLADNFNSGALTAWSAAVGTVSTDSNAQMPANQTGKGLKAAVANGAPAYVQGRTPLGEATFRASFYFDPNGVALNGKKLQIFLGRASNQDLFGIEIEESPAGSASYEAHAWVMTKSGPVYTEWTHLDAGPQMLRLSWEVLPVTKFTFSVGDRPVQELLNLDLGNVRLAEVRLGSVSPALTGETGAQTPTGEVFYDEFVSNRKVLIFLPFTGK